MADELATINQCTEITPKKRLTPKQRLFLKHYIECNFNGAKAARAMGYNEVSAPAIGSRMSRNVNVQLTVDDYLRNQGVSKPRLLTELTRLAYDPESKMVPLKSKTLDVIGKMTGLEAPVQQ